MVKAMAVFDLDRAVGCDAPCGHSAHSVPHATACTRADADISHYLVRPRRVAAAATMTAITNSLAALSLSTASGELRGGDDD